MYGRQSNKRPRQPWFNLEVQHVWLLFLGHVIRSFYQDDNFVISNYYPRGSTIGSVANLYLVTGKVNKPTCERKLVN